MKYVQINAEERSALAALRRVGLNRAEIARQLGRHPSMVGRELKRNAAPYDGGIARSVRKSEPWRGGSDHGETNSLSGSRWSGSKSY